MLGASPVQTGFAGPLVMPFDFSRQAIVLEVTVSGAPLSVMLDTGVDPSVIDLARARDLGLPVDMHDGGEVSGGGDAEHSEAYPSRIEELSIGHHRFN